MGHENNVSWLELLLHIDRIVSNTLEQILFIYLCKPELDGGINIELIQKQINDSPGYLCSYVQKHVRSDDICGNAGKPSCEILVLL